MQTQKASLRRCNLRAIAFGMFTPHLIAGGARANSGGPRAAPRQQRVVEARQARVQAAAEPGVTHDSCHVGALRRVGDQHPLQEVRCLRRHLQGEELS